MEKSTFNQVLDLLIPSAKAADKGVISGLVGGAAAAIIVVTTVAGEAMSTTLMAGFQKNGWVRAIWYGAFSTIGLIASKKIRSAAEDLDERAEQYRNLSEKLLQNAKGGIQMGGSTQSLNQGFASSSIKEIPKFSDQKTCFTGDKGQLVRDQACLCKKANNCKKSEVPTLNFQGFGGAGILNEPLSMFGSSANSLFGGDVSGAQASGAGIANSVGNLGKLRRKIDDKFNANRKKAGQDQINFAAAEGKFTGAFNKAIRQGLNTLTPAQASDLASMAPPEGSGKEKKDKVAAKTLQGPKIAAAAKSATQQKDQSFGFSLEDDPEGEISEGGINPDDLAGSMSGDNMFEGDISDRPDENIFKIITTRYLKSAYPNFFKENEIPGGK